MYDAKTQDASEPSTLDPREILEALQLTNVQRRDYGSPGGTWVAGEISGHAFEALVFPDHAESPSYELADSRISKLWVQQRDTSTEVASFDRGWDREPTTDAARVIVDLLAGGIAELVFNKK